MTSSRDQDEPNASCLLTSFASLLSFAKIKDGESPLEGSSESLPCFLSPTIPATELCCSFPSLCLQKEDKSSLYGQFCGKLPSLEEAAAFHLASPILCAKGNDQLIQAPSLLLNNVSTSFMFLINSRMKNLIKALVNQSKHLNSTQSGPDEVNTCTQDRVNLILCLLTGFKKPVEFLTVVTNFRVISSDDEGKRGSRGELERILPIIFEVVFEVEILGTVSSNFSIQVPGTITGSINPTGKNDIQQVSNDGLLTAVLVSLDTNDLLSSMMKHARVIVKTAASIATASAASSTEIPDLALSGADERKIRKSPLCAHRKNFVHRKNQQHFSVEPDSSFLSDGLNTRNSLVRCCSDGESSFGLSQDNSSILDHQVNFSSTSSINSSNDPLSRGYFSTDQVKNLGRIRNVQNIRRSVLHKVKQSTHNISSSLPATSRRVSFSFDTNVTPTGGKHVSPNQNASWTHKNGSDPIKKDPLKDANTAAIGLTLLQRPTKKRDRETVVLSTEPNIENKNGPVVEGPSKNNDYISPQLPLRKRRIKSCPGFSS